MCITYYKGSRVFVCKCGHAWYAIKAYPDEYVRGKVQCKRCFAYKRANIVEGVADVRVQAKCSNPYQRYIIKPEIVAEVYCKRCEEWFPITRNVRKHATCPKCDMVTGVNYAKNTGKYRERKT